MIDYSVVLDMIQKSLPLNYLNCGKFSIEPLKSKLKDDVFKNRPCANLTVYIPSSCYFTSPLNAFICRIVDDNAYFPTLGKDGVISLEDNKFSEKFCEVFCATLNQNIEIASFGCCHNYEACSDAKSCVHVNPFYAVGCVYKRNLDSGKIFYGTNRNVFG